MNSTYHSFFGLGYWVGNTRKYSEATRIRYGAEVSIDVPKGATPIKRRAYSKDENQIPQAVDQVLQALIAEHQDELFQWISEKKLKVELNFYFAVCKEKIFWQADNAIKQSKYEALWQQDNVQEAFGKLDFLSPLSPEEISDRMDSVFHRRTSKRQVSPDEKMLWILLSEIYAAALADGLVSVNPYKASAKAHRETLQTQILSMMARQSFTERELILFCAKCLKGIETGQIVYAAVLLCALTGMVIYEVCGLDWQHWHRSPVDNLSWLSVEREYYQTRAGAAEMRYKLRTPFAYRNVVCTEIIEWLLATLYAQRDSNNDAIFATEYGRLEPNDVKHAQKELLDEVLAHGGGFATDTRRRFGKNDDRQISNGDFLRASADYYLRLYCGFAREEYQAFLGRTPHQTCPQYYIDWQNRQVMKAVKAKLNRWHNSIVYAILEGNSVLNRVNQLEGYDMQLANTAPGQWLEVTSAHGAVVTIVKKEGDAAHGNKSNFQES